MEEKYESIGKKYNGEKAIISLTSWKARIDTVGKTLFSLLKMCPGFHIVLVLSEEEFPQKEKELPENLMIFVKKEFIEILWVHKNYKAFKKILFTMDKYRDVPIISADDDCIYICNYAEEFYKKWQKNKKAFISCYISKERNIPHLGGAATLYPPFVFGEKAIQILNRTKIYKITNQDDDFYTALRHKFKLDVAEKGLDYKKIYVFHDEIEPCHNEIKNLSASSRKNIRDYILDSVMNCEV